MAEYKGIKGFQVQTRTEDPGPTEVQPGDFYYNSTTGQFKTITAGGAPIGTWSSGGNMNTARSYLGGFGSQTSAIAASGLTTTRVTNVEEYDGSSWTEIADVSNALNHRSGAGITAPAGMVIAGASPSPPIVVETIIAHLNDETENGGYLAAARAKPRLDRVYASVARLVNAKSGGGDPRRVIALVESATVAWTRIFYSMAEQLARSAEEEARIAGGNVVQRTILMSEAEYAANVVAAVKFAREKNDQIKGEGVLWKVLTIPSTLYVDESGKEEITGIVDTVALRKMVAQDKSICMVCCSHIPTNSGIINPVEEIGNIVSTVNREDRARTDSAALPKVFYLVDACQSAGQIGLDVQKIKCHALAASVPWIGCEGCSST